MPFDAAVAFFGIFLSLIQALILFILNSIFHELSALRRELTGHISDHAQGKFAPIR